MPFNSLEHPDISRTLQTGYPHPEAGDAVTCCHCGRTIREDELYYDLPGGEYCRNCVEEYRRYA